ncbi:MAG: EAL domain-containing protein, partial [Betaproteobacteria bacterium]
DFGAGFSSFYYLKRFDVDYLKVDGGFIRELTNDDSNRVFVKALCSVAHDLNKQVIAEWVEERDTMKILMDIGAEYGQGYLFQRPAPLRDTLRERGTIGGSGGQSVALMSGLR